MLPSRLGAQPGARFLSETFTARSKQLLNTVQILARASFSLPAKFVMGQSVTELKDIASLLLLMSSLLRARLIVSMPNSAICPGVGIVDVTRNTIQYFGF